MQGWQASRRTRRSFAMLNTGIALASPVDGLEFQDAICQNSSPQPNLQIPLFSTFGSDR
jgi:hypothetical protein